MFDDCCILTTKDFTILEIMLERSSGVDDLLLPILKKKIDSAVVVFRDDVPAEVATLGSRVSFSVNGREPESRVISADRMTSPLGMFLPITTARGLALLGLSEGQAFRLTNREGMEERIVLEKVLYQPEAARRERDAAAGWTARGRSKPVLKLIRGALCDGRELSPVGPEGDDPGPSAA